MLKWIKREKTVNSEGTTITYQAFALPWLIIQSRKRHVPHAGGRPGTWDLTTYHLIANGKECEKVFMALGDAKEYAEGVGREKN